MYKINLKTKKMIKVRPNVSVESAIVTPETISVSQLLKDLANGIGKKGMCEKYNVKKWELDEVFKHSKLKGKRPAHVKKLSFTFVDDTGTDPVIVTPSDLISDAIEDKHKVDTSEPQFSKREEVDEVDPNQVTLETAITEATQDTQNALNSIKQTNEVIADMLSPTDVESPCKVNRTDDELEIPSFENTLELVEEQEMEAGTEEEVVEVEEDEFDSFQL
jgi:hypothetical protein|tara:strand:+ start:54 stop:710 length:657 start_codon:yes stop_codon:yes gene_type:complete